MNPYDYLTREPGVGDVRDLVEQLGAWHDSMVLHQRTCGRLGAEACGETCAHAVGRELWAEAKLRLGPAAESLKFLRKSVEGAGPPAAAAGAAAPATVRPRG